METQDWGRGHTVPFWNNEYKQLVYTKEKFNNPDDIIRWRREGYRHPSDLFTGFMCDMKSTQPTWNNSIIRWAERRFSIKNIGTSYYRMTTGTILPVHSDTYKKYIELFDCNIDDIIRILIVPEDWKSGHYLEINGVAITKWQAGDYFWWRGDVPHMAANIGVNDRYTIQITGHQ